LIEDKQKIQKDILEASDYIIKLEDRCYSSNETSLELLKKLRDSELLIERLKQMLANLKHDVAIYIPVKEDLTDIKIAEYINNYPERQKLKVMFTRESEGVYEFGTRRVYVRVEKDKINVRVGGGFLSIDEFID